jgi:long-chain acyl-CoA synthetase
MSNIADGLRQSVGENPAKTALIFRGEHLSYEAIDMRVDRLTFGLYKLGIRKGDRVAFVIGNHPDFVCLHYAALRAGAVSVPLNPSMRGPELRPYLKSVAPRVIVADESAVNEVMSAGPHFAPVFVTGSHATARPFGELEVDGPIHPVETSDDDLAVLAYTSGTAGAPKAAMLSHGNLSSNLDQMMKTSNGKTEPDDVVLASLPLSHIFALNVVIGLSFRQGASVLLEERFDPRTTLQAIVRHRVSIVVGAPPMYLAWLSLPDRDRFDLSQVRFAVSGASRLPPEVISSFRDTFGVEIWEGYGLTETSPTVSTTQMGEQRAGSIGRILEGQQVRIVDTDGNDVMVGDPGEIWVRGPNVFKGYWEDPEATAAVFSGDWFRTGDIAYQDEDGYLWLVDRSKEVIIVSGFNVYPGEVEQALRQHPGVLDAAVLGQSDPRQGERIKAYVVERPGESLSEEQLIVHCTKQLARFKVPSEVEFVAELPQLPSGKVLKRMIH